MKSMPCCTAAGNPKHSPEGNAQPRTIAPFCVYGKAREAELSPPHSVAIWQNRARESEPRPERIESPRTLCIPLWLGFHLSTFPSALWPYIRAYALSSTAKEKCNAKDNH